MKRFILGAVISGCSLVVASPSAQMPQYGVTVNAEKTVDFSKFKTYTWSKGQPSPLKNVDAQITAAVDKELAALGLTKAASGPGDVLVSYDSVSRTDVDLKAKPDAGGVRPQYSVGTLVVAMLDVKTRKPVLQMRTDTPIESKTDQLEPAINGAVNAMFKQYPTRITKK